MKKTTLVTALLLAGAFVFGQINSQVSSLSKLEQRKSALTNPISSMNGTDLNKTTNPVNKQTAFFSEDFESVTMPALPAGWTSTTAGTDAGFVTGDATAANACGYWPVATHTTFALSNDDCCDCDKSGDYLTLPVQDFTGQSNLALLFAAYDDGQYGQNPSTVELNINSGGWNVIYTMTPAASWQNITLPLTGTDNQASVEIRFHYDDAGSWATGLAIDDVVIDFPPNNDLAMVTDSDIVNMNAWLTPIYTQIPISQVGVTNFAGRIKNSGVATQSNVVLNVDVNDGSNTVYAGTSSALSTLASGSSSLFTLGSSFSPTNLGTYTFTFNASSDSTDGMPGNNTVSKSYEVTDTIFSRDDDNPVYQLAASSFGATNPYEFGNWFETVSADTATSISFELGPSTVVGTLVQGNIYADDGTTLLESTPFYTIQTSDIGTYPNFPLVTIPLNAPLPLTDSTNYIVSLADFSGTDTATRIITTGELTQADAIAGFLFADGSWGAIAYYPFVRLNVQGASTVCSMGATASSADATCPGLSDGTASVVATGGTAPYTYLWDDPGNSTNASVSGLGGGNYTVAITDAAGCQYNVAFVIDEPDAMMLAASAVDATCNGSADGSATVSVTGGTSPFTYLWDDPGTQNTATATGLGAGTYTVTVTDANGCPNSSTSATVSEPVAMVLTFSQTTANCGVGGTATLTVSGGVLPYTYLWDDPSSQTTATATNLLPGVYTVTLTDANGCGSSVTDTVQGTDLVTVTTGNSSPTSCGATDGYAAVSVVTGTAPFAYAWNDPGSQATDTATGLSAGVYTVTVTDFIGCSTTASVTLVDAGAPTLSITASTQVSCNGGNNGSATVTAFSGSTPYTYSWGTSPVQTTAQATGLTAGSYTVTVTDNAGCSNFINTTITEPATAVSVDGITVVDVLCNGGTNGSATATASGGTGTLTYTWTGGPGNPTYGSLGAGTYTIVVTDANSCTATDSATVSEPALLAISKSVTDVACKGDATGAITTTVSGGTGAYTYAWGGGETSPDLTGQVAGNYTVNVTDANGCTAFTAATIIQPTLVLSVSSTFNDETIAGQNDGTITAIASGGTGPYNPFWTGPSLFTSTSLTLTGLAPGQYLLTLQDANGCSVTDSVYITAGQIGIREVLNDVVFKVYPNPNTGQFMVELNNLRKDDYRIEIRNIIGQLVLAEQVSKSNGNFYKKLDLTTRESGVYFISLINDGGKITQKLVVY